jgi:hypothetical protein
MWSPTLAITSNGAGRALRSEARKGVAALTCWRLKWQGKGSDAPMLRYLYCRGNRSGVRQQLFETNAQDRERHAKHLVLFAIRAAWHPTHWK